jgi:hypothetical protein
MNYDNKAHFYYRRVSLCLYKLLSYSYLVLPLEEENYR